MHTVKWHKESDLSILHPLSDTIPSALFDAGHKGSVVDDAVEDLPSHQRVRACESGGRVVGVLRRGARPRIAHGTGFGPARRSA